MNKIAYILIRVEIPEGMDIDETIQECDYKVRLDNQVLNTEVSEIFDRYPFELG